MNALPDPAFGVPLPSAVWAARLLVAAILAILFLQSGLDKAIDRRGNADYLTTHFARSPLAPFVGPMLLTITIIELLTGVLSAIGVGQLLLTGRSSIAYAGALTAGVGLTALFFGQRVAKDYAGAAALVPYVLLVLAGIMLLGGGPRGPWH